MTTTQLERSIDIPLVFKELYSFLKEQGIEYRLINFLDSVKHINKTFGNAVNVPIIPEKDFGKGVDVVTIKYNNNTKSFNLVGSKRSISWQEAQDFEGKTFQTMMGILASMAYKMLKRPVVGLKISGPDYLLDSFQDSEFAVSLTAPFHESNYGGNQEPSIVEIEDEKPKVFLLFDMSTGVLSSSDKQMKRRIQEFVNKMVSKFYIESSWETSLASIDEVRRFAKENSGVVGRYGLEISTFYAEGFPKKVQKKVVISKKQ